jgi:hypothetical protein
VLVILLCMRGAAVVAVPSEARLVARVLTYNTRPWSSMICPPAFAPDPTRIEAVKLVRAYTPLAIGSVSL